ncbi:hypothetical protein Goshw_012270 [Gossypium schwendimanii]|uniref:Uncharacterized protein n=1 Tax=Gossypium schwendimanii TaxID=34291 RepID=A0A7J9NBZ0_GOSSC|nr:hypothetical protein [Gossypium schwendimanii]
MQIEETVLPRIYRERSSGKVARDKATWHSGGVCSRVQGTHAPSFRGDRKRSIIFFLEWIEVVGQTGTWSRERQAWVFQVRRKRRM